MKAVIVALALSSASAFQASTPSVRPATQLSAYVPSGMSPEEWDALQTRNVGLAAALVGFT